MAETTNDSQNTKETEAYFNKILEVNPNNYCAWHIKGKAGGWQSTLGANRFKGAVNCFTKSLIDTRSNFYKKHPDEDSALQLTGDDPTIFEFRKQMLNQCDDLLAEYTKFFDKIKKCIRFAKRGFG